MSREQGFAVLDKRYPEDGPRQLPKIMKDTGDELGFFMNPEASSGPNYEGIFHDLAKEKVTRKSYSKD